MTTADAEDKLRVLAFCDYFAEEMNGGVELVALETYKRMGGDTAVTVIAGVPGRTGDRTDWSPGFDVVTARGFDLSRLIGAQLSVAPMLWLVGWRAIRRISPHVIHASGIHFFGSFVAAWLAWLTRTPMVTTCHLGSLDQLQRRPRLLGKIHESTLGRFILWRSHRVIAVSDSVRDHIIELGVDPAIVDVIENGVDADRFAPGSSDAESVSIAVVGRLIANKGTMETAEVIHGLEGAFTAVFAGDGPLDGELEKLCASDLRLTRAGHVGDVAPLLARSDIFVRYSETEGRSLAVLEAMAAGCAVIVSDIEANTSLVSDEKTGLVVHLGDSEALRAALERLIGDAHLRVRLGDAAREATLSFTWENAASSTRKVLASVADDT